MLSRLTAVVTAVVLVAACTSVIADSPPSPESDPAPYPAPATSATTPAGVSTTTATATTPTTTTTTTEPTTTTTTVGPHARPEWLGTRPLPLRADGFGEVLPTPPELIDRAFTPPPLLPPPSDDAFVGTVDPVPTDVLARSTWSGDCPVALDQLAYITVSHWGFDGRFHTGEAIVHADHASNLVGVFEELHTARFPIEEMRVIRPQELDAPPTGDGNVTTSFVCRPAVGSANWSMHAYGLAIDINPFHNPYAKGDLVLPELASVYVDRERRLPGMIFAGDVVVTAFEDIGWHWGGRWNSLLDWMHFSVNNR
jgi:hypothetical protein